MKVRRHVPGPGLWAAIRESRWLGWLFRLFGGNGARRSKTEEGEWLTRVNRTSLVQTGETAVAGAAAGSQSQGQATPQQPAPTPPSGAPGMSGGQPVPEPPRKPPERPGSSRPLSHRLKSIQWGRGIERGRDWVQLQRWTNAFMEVDWRWLLGGTLGLALLTGYVLAAFVFFPAPFFNSDRPIPRVIGLDSDEAANVLRAAGFVSGEPRLETHPSVPRGSVSWQDPPEDVAAPAGSVVRLSVSRGPQEIPIPDVSRYEAGLARMLIVNAGLTVRRVDSIPTALPRNVAVGTRPAAGGTLSPGSPVVLIVSLGAPTLSVPDLRGLTLDEARELLESAGLTLGRSWREFSNAQPAELIFRQEPLSGTLIAPGSPVNVVLARTP